MRSVPDQNWKNTHNTQLICLCNVK